MKILNLKFISCTYSPGKTEMLKGKNTLSLEKKSPVLHFFLKELSLYKRKKKKKSLIKLGKEAKKLTAVLGFVKKYLLKMKVVPFFLSHFSCSWESPNSAVFQGHLVPWEVLKQFVGAADFQNSHNWTLSSERCPCPAM